MSSGAFLSVLRRPGVARPAAGAVLASLPIGMLGLAVLLLVQRSEGGFATAGLAVGLLGAGTALGMVVQGRLIDRLGQTRVLLTAVAVQAVAIAGLVLAARSGVLGAVLVCAFLGGSCEPQVNASLRALWPTLVPPGLLPAAMTCSSVMFEAPVLAGPLLLTVALPVIGPATAILLCGVLFTGGAVLLATSRASLTWRTGDRKKGLTGALTSRGVRTALLAGAAAGLLIGMVQVSAAALFTDRAGLMYAAISVGSLIGALAWGTRMQGDRPELRLAGLILMCAITTGVAALMTTPVVFAVALFAFGLGLGPTGVLKFSLAARTAPPGHAVEAFTLIAAAGVSAIAAGATVAGAVADRLGPATALTAAATVAVFVAVVLVSRGSR
ncbi:MFS transporter [Actinoplanes derwentensis]|uniref:Major Facilitator Superfamily protein n=1 Tax=Actinoplanes derwentensis TaxID=113562 RepID=A0A1H1YJE0_9ACTN|nr:MFS transporter [Actinoplanes derwentensis]GID81165.1 MFS transporter [Actinoplanes derwentensis]SDT21435.1 Major Facilitator Superfamily protein [Actinoplanes derwentensis]